MYVCRERIHHDDGSTMCEEDAQLYNVSQSGDNWIVTWQKLLLRIYDGHRFKLGVMFVLAKLIIW